MQGKTRARRLSADRAVLWTASAGMMALAMSTIFPLIFTLNTSAEVVKGFHCRRAGSRDCSGRR